jgi:protoheme IX farnesyltransferase
MNKKGTTSFFGKALELGKAKIAIPVSITAFTGYVANRAQIDVNIILPVVGVFFMAMGASAINHLQEIKIDSMMERTKNRPVPSGRISRIQAFIVALFFLLFGSIALYIGAPDYLSLLLGWITVFWYNIIYTYLKRISAFAVVPGSIVGALPPMIGWTASGGYIWDPQNLMLAFFFFIGQIPHFWLILLSIGKQYEQAGLPSITSMLRDKQIKNLTFIWIVATSASSILFILYGIISSIPMIILFAVSSIVLVFVFRGLVISKVELNLRISFLRISLYYLFVMLMVCIEQYI